MVHLRPANVREDLYLAIDFQREISLEGGNLTNLESFFFKETL